MGPRGDTQSKQGRSAALAPDAPEPTERGEASWRTVFAVEAEAAAEAHRRNIDQCTGVAAWTTTRLATGDWSVRRSRVLIVSSLLRPHVSRPDADADRYAAVVHRIAAANPAREQTARQWLQEILRFLAVCSAAAGTGSPSPQVDHAWHAFLLFARDHAAAWVEAAIEHAHLAGMYVSAGNPEAAAPVIERALQAIAPDANERPPVTAPMLTAPSAGGRGVWGRREGRGARARGEADTHAASRREYSSRARARLAKIDALLDFRRR